MSKVITAQIRNEPNLDAMAGERPPNRARLLVRWPVHHLLGSVVG
jgi:hypothetical protein